MVNPGVELPSTENLPSVLGVIELPIEFPTFSQKIQNFLSHQAVQRELSQIITGNPYKPEVQSRVEDSRDEMDSTVIGKRHLVVYGIQLEVFKRLQESKELLECQLSELPNLVSEMTQKVCRAVQLDYIGEQIDSKE